MNGVFHDLSESFRNYCYATQQAAMPVVLKLKDLRNDPDFFQKTCQVAFAILQLVIIRYPTSNLSRFSFVLSTANMHDFYRFLQYPRHWFFPVNAESIDEHVVLNDLTGFLDEQMQIHADDFGAFQEVIKDCLEAQLNQMGSSNDAYRNFDEFKAVLERRLRNLDQDVFDFDNVDLSGLEALNDWTRHVPFTKRILSFNWAIVDIGCVGLYAQGWGFIDTAKWAERIGQRFHLETWVVGLVSLTFAIEFYESARKLHDDALTPQEKRQERWNMITSLAECALFGAIYLNLIGKTKMNSEYIQCFAIVAKSLGLLRIVTRPRHEFFQQPEPV